MWTGATDKGGHGRISLHSKRFVNVHTLAWYLEHGVWPGQLNHTCGEPACWNTAHLYEGTQQQNAQDAVVQGGIGTQKLTVEQADEIERRYKAGGVTQRALAAEFGITQSTASRICTGRTWSHRRQSLARVGG